MGQAGYGAALRLCWGLLALVSQAAPQDGAHWVREALKAGALAFMRQVRGLAWRRDCKVVGSGGDKDQPRLNRTQCNVRGWGTWGSGLGA